MIEGHSQEAARAEISKEFFPQSDTGDSRFKDFLLHDLLVADPIKSDKVMLGAVLMDYIFQNQTMSWNHWTGGHTRTRAD